VISDELTEFAKRYAKAWCSQDPETIAAFFAENGSLLVNDGTSAVGRAAIAEIARGFMRDFSDLVVSFDKLEPWGGRTAFHWTLTGTYAGTGNYVRISGYELWRIDSHGLIAESEGCFDAAEYERQLKHGLGAAIALVR